MNKRAMIAGSLAVLAAWGWSPAAEPNAPAVKATISAADQYPRAHPLVLSVELKNEQAEPVTLYPPDWSPGREAKMTGFDVALTLADGSEKHQYLLYLPYRITVMGPSGFAELARKAREYRSPAPAAQPAAVPNAR